MNAVAQMEQAVAAGRLDTVAVYMATATDLYQPAERQYGTTAGILQAMTRTRGLYLVIQTCGPLADNPSDLAACQAIIANGGRVQLNMTLTTNDEAVRKACEPTCPSYRRRLDTAADTPWRSRAASASRRIPNSPRRPDDTAYWRRTIKMTRQYPNTAHSARVIIPSQHTGDAERLGRSKLSLRLADTVTPHCKS